MTAFIFDEIYLKHKPLFYHPENPTRLISILNELDKNEKLKEKILFLKPEKATLEHLKLAHDEKYIDYVFKFSGTYLDSDTYFCEYTLECSLYAVGGVIKAVNEIHRGKIRNAFCAIRPPGHHATINKAMGFCIFNNVAIGVKYAQTLGFKKIFIIDFDAHHGNGTQDIFYYDDTVFYFSTHQYPFYPGTGSKSEIGEGKGKGFTYNVPLPAGTDDSSFIKIYKNILTDLIRNFFPNLIFVSAGYDLIKDDPLANLNVSLNGIREIVKSIQQFDIPTIFCLEGGYNLENLAKSVCITLEEMIK